MLSVWLKPEKLCLAAANVWFLQHLVVLGGGRNQSAKSNDEQSASLLNDLWNKRGALILFANRCTTDTLTALLCSHASGKQHRKLVHLVEEFRSNFLSTGKIHLRALKFHFVVSAASCADNSWALLINPSYSSQLNFDIPCRSLYHFY